MSNVPAPSAPVLRAAQGDPAWSSLPKARAHLRKFHVLRKTESGLAGECGAEVAAEGVAPHGDVGILAGSVLAELRCTRPGCKPKWPGGPTGPA